MKWRYSLRWKLPRTPCPGPQELVSDVVEAGQPAPESVMSRWVAGAGYAVCVDFLDERQIRRKRAARTVLTGMCYSVGSATRQGSSSLTRFIGQSAMTLRT